MATNQDDELAQRRAEEYQMQLFGTHARTVYAALKQKIEANVDSRCKKLYESIEQKYKFDEKETATLKKNIKDLRKKYHENMQPHLVALQGVVNKFMTIPDNVLLEEDKDQAKQYTDEEYQQLKNQLKNLQEDVKRDTIFQAALEEELETLESLEKSQELATNLCEIVETGFKNINSKKISNRTQQTIDKCKDLTETLDAIKPETEKDIYNPKLNKDDIEPIYLNK